MRKILLMFSIFILLLSGCTDANSKSKDTVNLKVSKNFGCGNIYDEKLNFENDMNVMDVTEENLKVKTSYGGGFVNSINGLKSGFTDSKNKQKLDWFYYINGNLAQVGAKDYYLEKNDSIIWDYHEWNNDIYISSIIGSYPNNFTKGYEKNILSTEIKCSRKLDKDGKKVLDYLKKEGLKKVNINELNDREIKNENKNTIVIGNWSEIRKIKYIEDRYNNPKSDMFFKIEDKVKALNYDKQVIRQFDKGAVIASSSKGTTNGSSLWLITGNDEKLIKKALKILYKNPEKIKGKFSVIVTEKEVINIP